MNGDTKKKMEQINNLAKGDAEYIRMLQKGRVLEKKMDAVVLKLPYEDQDLVWDFVMLCETMSRRVLELACTYMEFPQE